VISPIGVRLGITGDTLCGVQGACTFLFSWDLQGLLVASSWDAVEPNRWEPDKRRLR